MAIQNFPVSSGPAATAVTASKANSKADSAPPVLNIIDIRRDTEELDILKGIHTGLRPKDGGEKRLPTLLLYDEQGLKLFEKITYLDEYYLTNSEIEVLSAHANAIAERIRPGSIVLELGSGNLRKVNILLKALEKAEKNIHYFALDLNLDELERTLSEIHPGTYKHVRCSGLHGTYDDGLEWLKSPAVASHPKTLLSLGSSIGNFSRDEAASFLKGWCEVMQPADSMLIGIDACKDSEKVYSAYNDCEGVTHQFIMNGLDHANHLLGQNARFNIDEWQAMGEYDQQWGRHAAFVVPRVDVVVDSVAVPRGERIRIEESYKYSADETAKLLQGTGFVEDAQWRNAQSFYGLHLISKPRVIFPMDPASYAQRPVPSLAEYEDLWKLWDVVTREMIPESELLSKPIKLRNVCLFYLGHIPTFLDIHLTRATNGILTEPSYYPKIFERGIDPDVENPEQCHTHSEVPENWPPAGEIIEYQARVRDRVRQIYKSEAAEKDIDLARALWLGFEHEIMHIETLLYMLVQSDHTLPPPHMSKPDFESLAQGSAKAAVPNQWFTVPESTVVLGLDDAHYNQDLNQHFGWDIEVPRRTAQVSAFESKARPITNGEYLEYLKKSGSTTVPASWHSEEGNPQPLDDNEDRFIRTVYGKVPLKYVLDWPVIASYDELKGCANWMGGRIPTMEEVRSIYSHVNNQMMLKAGTHLANNIPAVNGHLVNNGVQETPPVKRATNGVSNGVHKLDPYELFADLKGANVGFQHWHPSSVTANGGRLSGQGDFGGVWEWTSSTLVKHEGYEPMDIYPGYSSDFFDGKHNVVLGGSWATHPRIAGRKSFVNWYQHNYPFMWAGARVVRDI